MPKITLYGYREVPYTEKCRRALVLKKLEFELVEPAGPEDVRRFSPETGLLPVMTVDGELVSDSTNILLRLERIQPEPPLVSSDPTTAALQRQLEDWADESFLFYYREWLRVASEGPRAPAPASRPSLWARLAGRLRAAPAPAAVITPNEPLRGLEDRLDDLVNFLGQRPFFYSDRVSMADLTIYGMLVALARDVVPGSAARVAQRSQLGAFMRRVEEQTGG
ncbi:MAG TPA: glutathione S-transferase family protein [Myxococcota bacterium]|nr:glutathione S-transferase family protein [Myxococcota bacterium]